MVSETKLYDAFGEIIYAVAIADGMIQDEEIKVIEEQLAKYTWGENAKWSFNYERKNETQLKEAYLKSLHTLKENGPHENYYDLINILEEVAKANDDFEKKEGRVISIFNKTLRSHFLEYLDENGLVSNE